MKKIVVSLLILSAQFDFCPDDEIVEPVTQTVNNFDQARFAEQWKHMTARSAVAKPKELSDDEQLELALRNDPKATNYLNSKDEVYYRKKDKIKSRNKKKLYEAWTEAYEKKEDLESGQNNKKAVHFGGRIVDEGVYNPITIGDLFLKDGNINREKISILSLSSMYNLSEEDVEKILNNTELLSAFRPDQIQAINPVTLLKLASKQLIQAVLSNKNLLNRFSIEQSFMMNIDSNLKSISFSTLKWLLDHSDYINALDSKQIQRINSKTLSEALYSKLSSPLTTDFVNKLSNEQLEQLYDDHLAWGFHNLRTSFKENLTPDALQELKARVEAYKNAKA